jgi:hypothetical protein
MRVFLAESPRRRVLVLTALLLSASPAAAQLGPPIQLLPQAPAPSAPSPAPQAPAAQPAPPPEAEPDIKSVPLAPADNSWLGTLADSSSLPQEMWEGTPRSLIAAALPQLGATSSPVLQDLARRLLLSNAASPRGADSPDRPSLAALRLGRLEALGRVAGALAIMDELPDEPSADNLDRSRIELRFAANDPDGACRSVNERMGRYQNNWWDRALIACQALGGDSGKAALGLSLLREQKATPDPVFDALIEALGGQRRKIDKLPDPTPIRLALLAAAKLALPADALAAAGPAALHGYATNPVVPVENRLAAAERAANYGALTAGELAALYQKLDFKPEEQAAALRDPGPPADAKGRAILYAVARSNAPAETRASAVESLLADAKRRGAFVVMAQLVAPLLADLRPENGSAGFAADGARALLATGHEAPSGAWISASGARELWLVARLAATPPLGATEENAPLQDVFVTLTSRNSSSGPAQVGLLLTLLAAFDVPLSGLDSGLLLGPPHQAQMPSAALWVDQEHAAADKRVGETVLTTLLLAQAGDRLTQEPILLGRAIAGLLAVGLEPEAHALAIEAAISAGI